MNALEMRARLAFMEIHADDQVKSSTLAFIEAYRAVEGTDGTASVGPQPQEPPSNQEESAAGELLIPKAAVHAATRIHHVRRLFALAACLVFALALTGGTRVYFEPTAYIDIDVNPSIELAVNRFDRIIETRALNDDGQTVLDAVDVKHRSASAALETLVLSETCAPYLTETSFLYIGISSEDAEQAADLEAAGQRIVTNLPCSGCCLAVDEQTWQAAQAAHMGVGRYLAALQLMELDPNVTLEQCSDMTMRELRDRIAELGGSLDGGDGCNAGQEKRRNGHGPKDGSSRGARLAGYYWTEFDF